MRQSFLLHYKVTSGDTRTLAQTPLRRSPILVISSASVCFADPAGRPKNTKAPGNESPGPKDGGRSLRAPTFTHIRRLALAGRVLPDATLRGKAEFRSHGGTVPVVTVRDLRVRLLRPGLPPSVESRLPDGALTRLQA